MWCSCELTMSKNEYRYVPKRYMKWKKALLLAGFEPTSPTAVTTTRSANCLSCGYIMQLEFFLHYGFQRAVTGKGKLVISFVT